MSTSSATTRSASPTGSGGARFARLRSGIELCWDERGSGDPLVLIMGIGAQMVLWPEGLCDALAACGFRVIRFDNRDVGLSSKLDHLGVPPIRRTLLRSLLGMSVSAPYALEDMAEDVCGLLDELGIERAHVVGASMGGMIAQTMAITNPHRMRSLVSIMSTTGKPVLLSEPRALRQLFAPPPRTRDEAIERHLALFHTVRSTGYPFDEASVRERAGLSWDRGSFPRGVLRHLAAIGATGDRTTRLRFVRVPTLVLHGTVDPLIRPIGGRLTAEAIPGARLRWIEGMGHDLPQALWPLLTDLIGGHAREAG
jgi:pimeloyl-ACP methyl ester carboxylesterase